MSIKYLNEAWNMPLNSHEKILLLAIADCSNDEGFAYPGYKKLLQKTGMGREALSKHLKFLKELGVIKIEPHAQIGTGRHVNTYTISSRSELSISSDRELIGRIKDLRKKLSKPISSALELRKVRPSNSKSSIREHEPSVLTTSKEPSVRDARAHESEHALDSRNAFSENCFTDSEQSAAVKEKTKPRFVKPTTDEVAAYAAEKDLEVIGFYDFYESNGWMVGKNKMKNWKAAASGWNTRQKQFFRSGRNFGHALTVEQIADTDFL